jgi:branched-chain amino acid transport system substrate-binding protein
MSQKNDTPALILAFLVTIGLIGGGLFFFAKPFVQGLSSGGAGQVNNPSGSGGKISAGEVAIVPNPSSEKQRGIEAMKAGKFPEAVTAFESALQANGNDPEARIYLNNARIGQGESLTIAIAVPIDTDVNGAAEMLRGVAQVQQETNQANGINGKPLKVLIANDQGTPEGATAIANQLVQQSNVMGVVGHFSSGMSLAAGKVYEAGGLVMISPVSTSTALTGFGKYIFRTVPSDSVAAQALADYALNNLKATKTAVFYNSNSLYSKSLYQAFTDKMNASPDASTPQEFDFSASGFNPRQSYDQAVQQGANAIVLFADTGTLDPALAIVQANAKKLPMLAGDDVYSPKVLQQGQANASGMIIAVPWHILSDPQSAYAKSSQQLWKGTVNWRTAMSDDAAVALVEALKRNPSRSGLRDALVAADFAPQGATGAVRFRTSGDRVQKVQLVTVEPGTRSGSGFDFVPLGQ